MRLLVPLVLIAFFGLIYFKYKSNAPAPPSPTVAKPSAGPTSAAPSVVPTGRAPLKPVIVKQNQAPAPKPAMAPKYEDIRRANGFMPVPFRSSPAGGAIVRDAPLPGKVDGAVGQRISELPKGVVIQTKVRPIK